MKLFIERIQRDMRYSKEEHRENGAVHRENTERHEVFKGRAQREWSCS